MKKYLFLLAMLAGLSHSFAATSLPRVRGYNHSFQNPANPWFNETHVAELKADGANLLRIHLFYNASWGPFTTVWPQMRSVTVQTVQACKNQGIKAVVCFGFGPWETNGIAYGSPQMWARSDLSSTYRQLWREMVTDLAPVKDAVWGYDLFNEPHNSNWTLPPPQWRQLAIDMVNEIHSVDPSAWCIYDVGPDPYYATYQANPLQPMQTIPCPRVIYNFHMYRPHGFTHEDTAVSSPGSGTHRYPGTSSDYTDLRFTTTANKANLQTYMQVIRTFQTNYNVPVFVGEFSASAGAQVPDTATWLTDVISIFEQWNWSWDYHAFYDAGCWNLDLHDTQRRTAVFNGFANNVPADTDLVNEDAGRIPAAPTGLTATAVSSSQINLSWAANVGANSFRVKRATVSGGPYTTIASGVTSTSYSDTGRSSGTTYYYVVSAVNGMGESANSAQTSATTPGGSIAVPNFGFETPVTSTFIYNPGGASWTFSGNSGISANNSAFTSGNPNAPQGAQVAFLQRTCSVSQALSGFTPGAVYRVTFAAAQRRFGAGGQTWNIAINGSAIGTFAPPLSATNYVDYSATFTASATSHTLAINGTDLNGGDNTVFIDNVRITPALPSPWSTADIGAVGAAGNASYLSGTFSIAGSGADIWGTADEFRFVYQAASGDCEIRARVSTLQSTHNNAKAGVMIRESLNANASHAMVNVTPGVGVEFIRRTSTGGSAVNTLTAGLTAPYWVRVVRTGNTFTGYRSANGSTWTTIGTQTITMGGSVYIGLPVCSHADGTLCTATLDNVTATP